MSCSCDTTWFIIWTPSQIYDHHFATAWQIRSNTQRDQPYHTQLAKDILAIGNMGQTDMNPRLSQASKSTSISMRNSGTHQGEVALVVYKPLAWSSSRHLTICPIPLLRLSTPSLFRMTRAMASSSCGSLNLAPLSTGYVFEPSAVRGDAHISRIFQARWDVMFKFAPVWPPTELPHSPQVINSQPEPTSPAGTDVTLVDDTPVSR